MIGAILLALAGAATVAPDCAAARTAVPGVGACVAGPNGVAMAADEAAARALLSEATVAEQRFRDRFGRAPARYAVFRFDDPAVPAAAVPTLRGLGFRAVLALPSPALKERQMAEVLSRFAPAGVGLRPPQMVRREAPAGRGEPQGDNHIAHELGHFWYGEAFWGGGAASAGPRYGSPAPDWLDEAAAMLMENEAGTQAYHQIFADGRSSDAARAARIPPEVTLAELTSMTHPALVNLPKPGAQNGGGPISVIGRPSLFYPQVRVFVDYLAERSGDPRIVATISEGLRGGTTFEAWLGSNGAKHRLPASVAVMQADWNAWLDRRFGAAPSDR